MTMNVKSKDLYWRPGIGSGTKKAHKLDSKWKSAGIMNINCHEKRCYMTHTDAQIASDLHNFKILYKEFPMVPYFCSVHDTWHKGHNRKLNKSEGKDYFGKSLDRAKCWIALGISEDTTLTF
tara:strand:+ start:247 stop:612 length:366 start_codon:yes stop_codon:yes gene_type:complete